jgi:hypothetical protein
MSVDVDPGAATDIVQKAVRLLESYNDLVRQRVSRDRLASPSEAACVWCPYRGSCRRFLEQTEDRWERRGRISIGGTVTRMETSSDQVRMNIRVGGDRLSSEVGTVLPHLATQPVDGQFVAIIDGLPLLVTGDIHVDWETSIWLWP